MPRVRTQSGQGSKPSTKATIESGRRRAWPLPKPAPDGGWHEEAAAWWKAVTASAVVDHLTDYERLELVPLLRMKHKLAGMLQEVPERSPQSISRLATEIRAQLVALGLVPRARAALAWTAQTEPTKKGTRRRAEGEQMSEGEWAELKQRMAERREARDATG